MQNTFGNFQWFVGVVEDRFDPNFLGRLKVRCFGFHSENRDELPTEDLPWSTLVQSTNSAAQTEVGHSPTGLVEGSWVIGFFLDGEEAQQPVVMGSLPGYAKRPEKLDAEDDIEHLKYGFKDVRSDIDLTRETFPRPPLSVKKNHGVELGAVIHEDQFVERYPRTEEVDKATTMRLARGVFDERNYYDQDVAVQTTMGRQNTLFKEPIASKIANELKRVNTAKIGFFYNQPSTPYNAVYPFNQVWQTESGHVLEFDDTPQHERIHEYHRSGTFREIHPNGTLVFQTMKDKYDITEAHSFEYAKGNKFETFKRGHFVRVNDSDVAGSDAVLQVCGSANYIIELDSGDFEIKIPNGQLLVNSNSFEINSRNQMVNQSHLIINRGGNFLVDVTNDVLLSSQGAVGMESGSVNLSSTMNTNISAGDSLSLNALHAVSITAENSIAMFPFYFPEPIAIHQVARMGHIEHNAQDGDIKLVSKPLAGLFDIASLVVTSPLPTSAVSIAQPQPAPEFETHVTHPGSIIGQTMTGYIYFVSKRGDIVLEAQTLNSVKLKTTPLGTIEATSGQVDITATIKDVDITARKSVNIDANLSVSVKSKLGTEVQSGTTMLMSSGTNTDINSKGTVAVHAGVAVRLGDYAATETALKGQSFVSQYLRHTHLTPMGITSPVNQADPSIITGILNSYCKKTFVF